MARKVTETEFFAYMNNWSYEVTAENDRINGYSNDCYIDTKTLSELGFISFHMERDPDYYVRD